MTFQEFYSTEAVPMLHEWGLIHDETDPAVYELILLRTWKAAQENYVPNIVRSAYDKLEKRA